MLDFGLNSEKTLADFLGVLVIDNLLGAKHFGVSEGAL
jgi:hypothetical protein